MTEQKTLTLSQAAQIARIAPRNLQRWLFAGILKADKPDGLHWAIMESDLFEALAKYPPAKGGRGIARKKKRGKSGGRGKTVTD